MKRGYAGAGMEQVAEEAGFSRAALYKHFANKEALFLAVAASLHQNAAGASQAVLKQARRGRSEPVERILDFMMARHRYYATHLGNSPYAVELAEESSRRCGSLVRKHGKAFRAGLVELIAGYAENGAIVLQAKLSPAALADMLIAAAKGLKSPDEPFAGAGYETDFRLMAKTLLAGAILRQRGSQAN